MHYFSFVGLGLLLLLVVLLPVAVFGGGALLYVGGRFLAKAKKATYWRCVGTVVLASLACGAASGLISVLLSAAAVAGSAVVIVGLLNIVVNLVVTWLIIKAMLGISFGKAVLAWLPLFGGQSLLIIPLLVSILLPSLNNARDMAKNAMSMTNLNGIGKGLVLYASSHDDVYPPNLDYLAQDGMASPKMFCHPDGQQRYFYFCPTKDTKGNSLIACEPKSYFRDRRNVLYLNGKVETLPESEFQALLTQPENAKFAAAYTKAHWGIKAGVR